MKKLENSFLHVHSVLHTSRLMPLVRKEQQFVIFLSVIQCVNQTPGVMKVHVLINRAVNQKKFSLHLVDM